MARKNRMRLKRNYAKCYINTSMRNSGTGTQARIKLSKLMRLNKLGAMRYPPHRLIAPIAELSLTVMKKNSEMRCCIDIDRSFQISFLCQLQIILHHARVFKIDRTNHGFHVFCLCDEETKEKILGVYDDSSRLELDSKRPIFYRQIMFAEKHRAKRWHQRRNYH